MPTCRFAVDVGNKVQSPPLYPLQKGTQVIVRAARDFRPKASLSLAVLLAVALSFWACSERQPINHTVIILQENHTFDNYFGTFPGADGVTSGVITLNGHVVVDPNDFDKNRGRDHDNRDRDNRDRDSDDRRRDDDPVESIERTVTVRSAVNELIVEYVVPTGSRATDVKIGVRLPGTHVRGLGVAPR